MKVKFEVCTSGQKCARVLVDNDEASNVPIGDWSYASSTKKAMIRASLAARNALIEDYMVETATSFTDAVGIIDKMLEEAMRTHPSFYEE
jgi:hypothetical protein